MQGSGLDVYSSVPLVGSGKGSIRVITTMGHYEGSTTDPLWLADVRAPSRTPIKFLNGSFEVTGGI